MRKIKLPREFYIPRGSIKVEHKATGAVAYLYERNGHPCAVAFFGKADKPAWQFRFSSPKAREARVRGFFEGCRERQAFMKARREERKAAARGLAVGDVLRASWGYEQTNIDYYEVTRLVGRTMVEIRQIAQERVETLAMQGDCVPLPGQYIGKPSRHVAKDGAVRLTSFSWARKVDPQMVAGVKVYQPSHWSAYH